MPAMLDYRDISVMESVPLLRRLGWPAVWPEPFVWVQHVSRAEVVPDVHRRLQVARALLRQEFPGWDLKIHTGYHASLRLAEALAPGGSPHLCITVSGCTESTGRLTISGNS